MAMISSFSSPNSDDDDHTTKSSKVTSTVELLVANSAPSHAARNIDDLILSEKTALRIRISHTNEQKPWGWGSPRRDSTMCVRTSPVFCGPPSKKCYGAPDLLTSKKSLGDGKKSLADLSRVTKFPMASLS
jgi:hypothetical protein